MIKGQGHFSFVWYSAVARRLVWVRQALCMNQIFQTLVLAAAFVFPALAISGPMTIKLYPPDPESRVIGEQWAIYLDGEIDKNASARLAAALAQNSISGGTC